LRLFPHQLSAIDRMRALEIGEVRVSDTRTIRTSIGLYTDKPGAGKSYAILTHLLTSPPVVGADACSTAASRDATQHEQQHAEPRPSDAPDDVETERKKFFLGRTRSMCGNRVTEIAYEDPAEVRIIPTSIVLVPPSTFSQWESYVHRLVGPHDPRIKMVRRFDTRMMRSMLSRSDESLPQIMILDATAYGSLLSRWATWSSLFSGSAVEPPLQASSSMSTITSLPSASAAAVGQGGQGIQGGQQAVRPVRPVFQRLVIDEADSIYVKNFEIMDALFLWIVTATPETLNTSSCRPYAIRALFFDSGRCRWNSEEMRLVREHLQIRHEDEVIDAALQLPPPQRSVVVLSSSALYSSIRPYIHSVSALATSAIEACDYERAVGALGCSCAESDDGIIAAFVSKLEREMRELQAERAFYEQNGSDEAILDDIARRITKKRVTIDNVMRRVKEAECCPIGLEEIQNKAVTPCCHNAFEFANLMRALSRSAACPLCKTRIDASQLVVSFDRSSSSSKKENGEGTSSSQQVPNYPRTVSKDVALSHELSRALREDPESRILVFSCFYSPRINTAVIETCTFENVGYYFARPYDRCIPPHEMDAFRNGLNRVMVLNAHAVGAGVNIECATHVFTTHSMAQHLYMQVIGRAQRIGRRGPLKIVDFRYENEDM